MPVIAFLEQMGKYAEEEGITEALKTESATSAQIISSSKKSSPVQKILIISECFNVETHAREKDTRA